ncbi:MAG: tRNA (adenosine(37)-N6)-threonylcarbamoyltransferase complex ATPase subunit type 1 TsaE [Patescibacteria group bacterium]|nr:tRNA (adenosine(37)-N6)-threonylcarbamoyltransferase complex ATPase subunit type 1 TsaE [Patescibacteria group bacterium]
MNQQIFTKKEIPEITRKILNQISKKEKATVVAFSGDLGTGKTTLIQSISNQLGIKDDLNSPTFVLIKFYGIEGDYNKLIHVDAYRLESSKELIKLNWNELLKSSNNLILIEWPEKVPEAIPEDAIWVKLEHVNEEIRKIELVL